MEYTSINLNNGKLEFACTNNGVSLSGNCEITTEEQTQAALQATETDPFKGFKDLLNQKMGVTE